MQLENSIVRLQPGIYILRHPKGGMPPISVGRALGDAQSTGRVEALSTPGTHGTILRDGSDCIVMQVSGAPVDLLVTSYLPAKGASMGKLRIDHIGLDEPSTVPMVPAAPAAPVAQPVPRQVPAELPIQIAPHGLTLIGHIERVGDAVAVPGATLGDASSGLRLEGFQIEWPDAPAGVRLEYAVSVEGVGALPQATTGNFCGTRGQGLRINELHLHLTGPNASLYQLDGRAHFSGGFAIPVGDGAPISGPSGLEHLVALRLAVIGRGRRGADAPKGIWEPSSRTKVVKKSTPSKRTMVKTAP